MSLLSSFIAVHLLPALETALIAHAPDAQNAILTEIQSFAAEVNDWLAAKIAAPVVPAAPVETVALDAAPIA